MIVAVLFLLLMAGGAGATVGALWYLHVPPFQVASADTHQAANQPPDAPAPDKPDPAKPDKPDPVKPNPPDKPKDPPPNPPDKPKDPPPDQPDPAKLAAGTITKEAFDKIAKGMSMDDLVALGGQPTTTRKIDPTTTAYVGVDAQASYVVVGGAVIIDMFQGKVVDKKTTLLKWPVVWPADAAQNPPPDNPADKVTKENFDKIDKGMPVQDLFALLGKPGAPYSPGLNLNMSWTSPDHKTIIGVTVSKDKVISKVNSANWPVVYPSEVGKNPPPPPPDKPTPGLTKDNYLRVVKGMPDKELLDLFGQPTQVRPGDGNETILTWLGTGPVVTVATRGGKVWRKENDQKWSNLEPPPDKNPQGAVVTQDNFDKIDRGMTKEQLTLMFGPPRLDPATVVGIDAQWVWVQGNTWMQVNALKDKAVSKQNSLGWKAIYPSLADVRMTPESFDKIARGMTQDDLAKLFGGPAVNQGLPVGASGDTNDIWVDGNKVGPGVETPRIIVTPRRYGKVIDKQSLQAWRIVWPDVAKNPPPDKLPPGDVAAVHVTKDGFDKIAKDMSEDEVAKLLGGPWVSLVQSANGVAGDVDYLWADGGKVPQLQLLRLMVTLHGGKVIDKKNFQDWPIVSGPASP